MRALLAILAGIIVGLAAIYGVSLLAALVFPPSLRVTGFGPEQAAATYAALPTGLKIGIVLSWFAGPLVGAAAAKRIAGGAWAAWTMAGLFALYVLLTVLILPMPGWMQAVAVVAPLLGGLVANHLVADRLSTRPDMEAPLANP